MKITSNKENMGLYQSLLLLMIFAILIVNIMIAVTLSTNIKKQQIINKKYMDTIEQQTLKENMLNIGNDADGSKQ